MQEQGRSSPRTLQPVCTLAAMVAVAFFVPACASDGGDLQAEEQTTTAELLAKDSAGCNEQTPIRLALEIDNGVGVPLKVRAGQAFYLNQIDIRAVIAASVDEGVKGLASSGDFAGLSWAGASVRDTEPLATPNPDGTITRRRFYQGATWMKTSSQLVITQVNQLGLPTALPITIKTGSDSQLSATDSFFIRRFRAIQWTYDCPSSSSCAGAHDFEEEALVELRNLQADSPTHHTIAPGTKAFKVVWSLKPLQPYFVPVTQVSSPDFDYGISPEITALTPPCSQGFYQPGQDITFQLTLRDAAGKRLHDAGSLPTYNDVMSGKDKSGIQYYRAFIDPTATYWRRKHRERMLMAQIVGPAQKIQPIRSSIPFLAFSEKVQDIAVPEVDGVFSQFNTFPSADILFGGASDPTQVTWSSPVSDTWTYHLPANAEPGTYLVTLKGRRTYLGEDVPFSKTIEIQVGAKAPTEATLTTGPCNTCHSGGSALGSVLHGNAKRSACAGCHAPLAFELEGPVGVRVHFIHSRSNRYPAATSQCSSCHLTAAGTQRTSKSACLSCHTSYPADHVAAYGPVTSAYVGGGAESFQQCSTTCHLAHPGSGL